MSSARTLLGFGLQLALAATLLAAAPVRASAQIPDPPASVSDEDDEAARQEFIAGVGHARAEEWEQALSRFTRSYELGGSPIALFNMGGALRHLNRFMDAQLAFDRMLADDSLDAASRQRAEEMRNEVGAHVSIVSIDGFAEGEARIEVRGRDGGSTTQRPIEFPTDPGETTIRVEIAPDYTWTWQGSVPDGDRLSLDAETDGEHFFAEPEAPPAPASGGDDTPVIVAAVVLGVLAAGAIIGAVVADQSLQLGPRTDFVINLP